MGGGNPYKRAKKEVSRSASKVSAEAKRAAESAAAEAKRAKEKLQEEAERVAKQAAEKAEELAKQAAAEAERAAKKLAEETERVATQVRDEAKRGLRAAAGTSASASNVNSAISLGSDVGASPGTIGATLKEKDKKSTKLIKKKKGTTGTKIKKTPLKEAGGIQI